MKAHHSSAFKSPTERRLQGHYRWQMLSQPKGIRPEGFRFGRADAITNLRGKLFSRLTISKCNISEKSKYISGRWRWLEKYTSIKERWFNSFYEADNFVISFLWSGFSRNIKSFSEKWLSSVSQSTLLTKWNNNENDRTVYARAQCFSSKCFIPPELPKMFPLHLLSITYMSWCTNNNKIQQSRQIESTKSYWGCSRNKWVHSVWNTKYQSKKCSYWQSKVRDKGKKKK